MLKNCSCRTVLDAIICCETTFLDRGIHVLLYGGHRSHVGSVSTASPGTEVSTLIFPGHKEAVISEKWASALAAVAGLPVTVCCGIHYNNATAEEIAVVVRASDQMLDELLVSVRALTPSV